MAESYAVVGCSDDFECDSAGSVSRLGRQTRFRKLVRPGFPFRPGSRDLLSQILLDRDVLSGEDMGP